jgi:hypothetical protein
MKRIILFSGFFCLFLCLDESIKAKEINTYKFNYSFTVKDISKEAKKIECWVPYPCEDAYQAILKADINVHSNYRITEDDTYHNKMIYIFYQNPTEPTLQGSITYEIKRTEQLHKLPVTADTDKMDYPDETRQYLKPSRYAVISPEIKKLAEEITKGTNTTTTKAKVLYDYVFSHMEYDKNTPGWGQGDSERACRIGKGNCTDFHSLFICLSQAVNIPAKFEIGFKLPNEKQAEVKGYHCWAEFYASGAGWIPVDISEAWKDKAKKNYYFGDLDADRVQFTTGRDIMLTPPQKGEPLNYFIYPYVEIDGVAAQNVSQSFAVSLINKKIIK